MRIIYRIARLDLARLFYSPVAWLLLVIFCLQSGLRFIAELEDVESYEIAGQSLSDLSKLVFSGNSGVWNYVKRNLYLYIPLLTMGLISKETGSGSIKLLYSSPVRFRQIVLGKFSAMVIYISFLMAVLVILTIAGGVAIKTLDYAYVLTGVLGLFLLCCTYAAIGLFISSLTSYQIVAAIGTLAVLSFFNLVGGYGQTVPVLKDILFWLSISGRAGGFIDGLINSQDLFYLLLVIGLFLALTVIKLSTEKKVYSRTAKTGIYSGLVALFVGLIYLVSIPSLTVYKDLTATKKNTLTLNSQEVVSKMEGPVKITSYVNLLDPYAFTGSPKAQNADKKRTNMYTRFLPHIEYSYVYFYDSVPNSWPISTNKGLPLEEIAEKMAKSYKVDFEEVLSPEAIKKQVDLTTEDNHFVRVVEHNDRKAFIRFYKDVKFQASENEITPALKTLLTDMVKVGFLTGNGERSPFSKADNGYDRATTATRLNREALISKGFAFQEVTLSDPGDLPEDLDILVVSDPKGPLPETVLNNLKSYIDNGGNMLLACEPDSYTYVQYLLDYLGITVVPGTLQQQHKDFDNDFILARVHVSALNMHKGFNQVIVDTKVSFPNALALGFDAFGTFDANPVVVASPEETWRMVEHPEAGHQQDSVTPEAPLPVMVALTRNVHEQEQRIVVSGDADFMSNLEYNRDNVKVGNSRMIHPLFGWLAQNEFPVDTSRPPLKDTKYALTESGFSLFRIIFNIVLPVLVLIAGTFLLIMRKRK